MYEACERFGWQVHAFVLMSNHYHLCLETRNANLGLGMQWLQVMHMDSRYGISKAIAEEMRMKEQRGLWQKLMIAKS